MKHVGQRCLGIDLGGTKIEGVVIEDGMRVVERCRIATERNGGYEHILGRVTALATDLRRHAPDCERIGIGTPGALSYSNDRLKNSNTTCLNGQPLLADLVSRLGLEVRLENDANCFALAEARQGAATGARLVFGVILGTGVGGGLVWDGEIWTGSQRIAGEWGHHRVDPAGAECYCGQRGCVETILSGPALERAYVASGGAPCSVEDIVARATSGEGRAVQALDGYVEQFGRALANVINIVDPDVVVLGGGLSNLDLLYTRGREVVERYVFNDELRTPIVRNRLGDSAGVIGAALLVAA